MLGMRLNTAFWAIKNFMSHISNCGIVVTYVAYIQKFIVWYGHIGDTFLFHWKQISFCHVSYPVDSSWGLRKALSDETG